MKITKYLLILMMVLGMILTGCQPAKPDSETAMNNFQKKLEEGNYVITKDGFLKISVPSKDQVTFEYNEDNYHDFVAMSINNEVFQAFIEDGKLSDASFLGEGCAIDAAKKRLPSYWFDESVSEGNIWNLFYNDTEDPLKFVSYDDTVKETMLTYAGYPDTALRLTQEVYLTLDKENPKSAKLHVAVDDDFVARLSYDDIDVNITFGNAKSNALADEWAKNPAYPEARTAWNDTDEFIFNSVFLPGYGLKAIPFPKFTSYALSVDGVNFVMDDEVSIRDSRASQQDMADYIATLKENGFKAVTEKDEDGVERTYYRKLLREAYRCYSSIYLEYDNGINLTANKYYDSPVYDSLNKVNEVIAKAGYPTLSASDNFTSVTGKDDACSMTEGWLYFFDYDLGLFVDMDFKNRDETIAYLQDYAISLGAAGFEAIMAEDEIDRYENDKNDSVKFNFIDDDTVSILFKSEKYFSPAEVEKMLTDAGFPEIHLTEPISCRELKNFYKVRNDVDFKTYLAVSQKFESAEKAEEFLSNYEAALNELGLERDNPAGHGTLKSIVICNDDGSLAVGIDFIPESAEVYFDFMAQ